MAGDPVAGCGMLRRVSESGAPPCVIYAAKSTEDVRGSIPTQIADCRAAIERRGGRIYGEPQVDEKHSAFRANRGPGLAQAKRLAVEAAERHGAAELWVQHSDRLARGDGVLADHLAEVFFSMRRVGVRLRSVQDDPSLQDVIHAALMGERNSEDSRRKSEAVRAGKRRQFDRGEPLGGPVPDGYRRVVEVDASGSVAVRYELDAERLPVVQRVFELAASPMADANVARALNRAGLRTKGGVPWTRRRVQDTTTNPFYAGRVARGRSTPGASVESRPGRHPPLVDPATFDALQVARRGRDRATGSDRRPGRPNSRHLLAGLAHCWRCGELMRPRISTNRRKDGSQARSYLCRHVSDGTGLCALPVLNAEWIDAAVVEQLKGFIFDYDAWVQTVGEHRHSQRASLAERRNRIDQQLASLGRREQRLAEDYARHVASGNEDRAEIAALALAQDRTRLAQHSAELRDVKAAEARVDEQNAGDALLDFHNELRAALSGVLGKERPMLELNAELRRYFSAFMLDHGADGRIAVGPLAAPTNSEVMWAGLNQALRDDRWERLQGPFPQVNILLVNGASVVVSRHSVASLVEPAFLRARATTAQVDTAAPEAGC